MVVISFFDGMACGLLSLKRAGFTNITYYASEIDKYAMKVAKHNHPEIIHIGDVTKVRYEANGGGMLYTENGTYKIGKVDLIIGGSPCQGFSFAGKQLNFNDPRSKLFFEFVRLKEEIDPTDFLLENVVMKQEYQDVISKCLSVKPVHINSALVSAQNRKRLYWTSIPFYGQPEDKGVFLKDIIQTKVADKYFLSGSHLSWWERNKDFQLSKKYSAVDNDKAICMVARQFASWNGNFVFTERRTAEAKEVRKEHRKKYGTDFSPRRSKELTPREDNKANCITTSLNNEHILCDSNLSIRQLTPTECERLQTVPDNYTSVVSDSQAYKMLGNGWTVDVIVHLLLPLYYADI